MIQRTRPIKIIDYEGSSYQTDFWEGQGREFEDLTERNALRRLLPTEGNVLIEVGAGFGRLADLYDSFEQIVLVDYSMSLLEEAHRRFGDNTKYHFVAANVYRLPFVDDLADVVVMIRVAHHLEAVDLALEEIHRVLQGGKVLLMEYANKRNAKAVVRFLLRKQSWNPFVEAPYEFVPLNFDFHPRWMRRQIEDVGFLVEKELAISHFRLAAVKERFSPSFLARIDNVIAAPASFLKLSPSVLTKNIAMKPVQKADGFYQCPRCQSRTLHRDGQSYICANCHETWMIRNGIIDFRYPHPEG